MSTKSSVFRGLMDSWRQIGGRRRDTDISAEQEEEERRQEQRRRDPRLTLDRFGEEAEHMGVRLGGHSFMLCDLSLRGFRIELSVGSPLSFSVGIEADAELFVENIRVPMHVRVANAGSTHVGFEILEADPTWKTLAPKLLDPVLLGKQLREIDARFVKPDRHGNVPRWFQGGPACDLFVWFSPLGQFLSAQLFFLGQVVDWSPGKGVRTGLVQAREIQERGFTQSELFDLKSPPDNETLIVARRLLAAATLPQSVRQLLRC